MSDADTGNSVASGGHLSAFGGMLHWLVGLLEPVRHMVVNLGVLAGILIGGPAVYKQVVKSTFVIRDISVPPAVASRGLSGEVIAQQILDHIAEIDKQAGSRKEKVDISGIDSGSAMPSISLPVGGLNLAAIISELRTLFGYTETKVTGEIFIAQPGDAAKGVPDLYGLRLRIAGKGPLFRSDTPSSTIEPLIDAAAQQIMRRYDPINLGYYFYRKKAYDRATDVTDEVMASAEAENVPWAFMMRGLIALELGHHAEAAVDLREAVARQPNFLQGYITLATILRQDGSLDEAEAAARKAIELAPSQYDGHAALAQVLEARNQLSEALAEMEKGVQLQPSEASAHYKLGRLLARLNRFEDALKSYQTAVELKPTAAALIQSSAVLHSLKRDDDALRALQQATHVDPKNPRAWERLGETQLERKSFGQASRSFQRAIALDLDSSETLLAVATALDTHRRTAEADQVFERMPARLARNPAILLGWSEHLWTAGHKPEAMAKLHEALAIDPIQPPVVANAGHQLQARGDTAGAIEAYKRAILLDPSLERTLQPIVLQLSAAHAELTPPSAVPNPTPVVRASTASTDNAQVPPVASAPHTAAAAPAPAVAPAAAIRPATLPRPSATATTSSVSPAPAASAAAPPAKPQARATVAAPGPTVIRAPVATAQ